MARRTQQPAEGLSPAEQQIADMADVFVVRGLEKGRFQKRMYRGFPEAFTAAAMNPDKKATVTCVDADNQSVAIPQRMAAMAGRAKAGGPRMTGGC